MQILIQKFACESLFTIVHNSYKVEESSCIK